MHISIVYAHGRMGGHVEAVYSTLALAVESLGEASTDGRGQFETHDGRLYSIQEHEVLDAVPEQKLVLETYNGDS